jgi:hypothetical protein
MTNNSLPTGFDKLKTEKPYINLGKLIEGEYKFRIVQRPIAGWIDWKDRKPYRFRPENKPKAPFDATKPIKPFWALHVWDYTKEGLFVMEVTQNSIRKALEMLALNEDWGDLTTFDFRIKKEGTGIDTSYSVIPTPHKSMSPAIKEAVGAAKIRLEALYEGKDPWNDLEETFSFDDLVAETAPSEKLSEEQCAQLDACLLKLNDSKMKDFICKRQSIEHVHDLHPDKFKDVMGYLETQLKLKPPKENSHESKRMA